MTFDDDFLQLNMGEEGVVYRVPCYKVSVNWPPPKELRVLGYDFKQKSCSKITDEQRLKMTHVCRGAEYDLIQHPVLQEF